MPHSCWFFSTYACKRDSDVRARIPSGVERMCDFYSFACIFIRCVNCICLYTCDFHLEFYLCTGEKVTKKSSFMFTIIYLYVRSASYSIIISQQPKVVVEYIDLCMNLFNSTNFIRIIEWLNLFSQILHA